MDVRLIKNQILCRIQVDFLFIKLIILIDFLRPLLTESNDDFI